MVCETEMDDTIESVLLFDERTALVISGASQWLVDLGTGLADCLEGLEMRLPTEECAFLDIMSRFIENKSYNNFLEAQSFDSIEKQAKLLTAIRLKPSLEKELAAVVDEMAKSSNMGRLVEFFYLHLVVMKGTVVRR